MKYKFIFVQVHHLEQRLHTWSNVHAHFLTMEQTTYYADIPLLSYIFDMEDKNEPPELKDKEDEVKHILDPKRNYGRPLG